MRKSIWLRGLVFGIVVLLVGTSIVPNINSKLEEINNESKNAKYLELEDGKSDYDWEMLHKDSYHSGFSQDATGTSVGNVKWVHIFDSSVSTSPAIVGNDIYIGAYEIMSCLDRSTGEINWVYNTGSYDVKGSPAVVGDYVYFGCTDDNIYKVDRFTGDLEWTFQTGDDVKSAPAYYDGYIYFGSDDFYLYSVSLGGNLKWQFLTTEGIETSPAVTSSHVFCTSGSRVYGITRNYGVEDWSVSLNAQIYADPMYHNGKVYVGSVGNKLYCLDEDEGEIDWTYDTNADILTTAAVSDYDDRIFFGAGSKMYCLEENGSLVWTCTVAGAIKTSPAIANNEYIYFGGGEIFYCVYVNNGTIAWSYNAPGTYTITKSPALRDDNVIVGYLDYAGRGLYCFGSEGGSQPPVADFDWSPSNPNPGDIVIFDASESEDPDGYLILYEWDWNNDGVFDENSSSPFTSYSWDQSGDYSVTLRVTDNDGITASKTRTVHVIDENQPPYEPSDPSPGNHDTGINLNAYLSWIGGDPDPDDFVTYDVYFGTTNPPSKVAGNQSETTYDPLGLMNPNTKYYWKINAWDNHDAKTVGTVWDFTTINGGTNPVADAGGPYYGDVDIPVSFDASNSYDIDGTIVGYRWDWTNDGTWDEPTSGYSDDPTASHIYQNEFTGQVKLEVKDNSGNADDDTAAIIIYNTNENLLAYWNFDDGVDDGTITDVTGNGWTGYVYGNPQERPGAKNNCLFFDGDDYIQIDNFTPIKEDESITLSFWIKPHTIKYPQKMCIFDNMDLRVFLNPEFTDNNIDWMWMQYHKSYHYSDNLPVKDILSGHSVYDGGPNHGKVWFEGSGLKKDYMVPKWQFVVCMYDKSAPTNEKNKLYIDGILCDYGLTYDNHFPIYKDFNIGACLIPDIFDPLDNFKGHLDEIRVYQRALSSDEIQFLYSYPMGNGNPPCAVIDEFNPYAVRVGETVNFFARGYDTDGSIAQYQWDFNGDMNFEWTSITTGTTQCIYNNPGMYLAGFRVIDNQGKASPVEYERIYIFKNTAKIWVPGTYADAFAGNSSMGIGAATFGNSVNENSGAVSVYSNVISAFHLMYGESHAVMVTPEFTTTTTHTFRIETDLVSVGGVDLFWGIGASVGDTGGQIAHFQFNENEQRWELKHGITSEAIDPWWEIDNLLFNIVLQLLWLIPIEWPIWALSTLFGAACSIYLITNPNELDRALKSSDSTNVYGDWRITLEPGRHIIMFGPYSSVSCVGVATGKASRFGQVRFIEADKTNLPPNNDLIFTTLCPINLNVSDPMGRYINITNSTIPGARYLKIDLDFDGLIDNYLQIPNPVQGEYKVQVIPDINSSQNDTFSISVNADGGYYNLVNETKIENIPIEGYIYSYLKPLIPQNIIGPSSIKIQNAAIFSTSTTHPENDSLYYMWDWGDGNFTEWFGPYESGETVQTSYAWRQPGFFEIKVRTKSINGPESNWSEPFKVEVIGYLSLLIGGINNDTVIDGYHYFETGKYFAYLNFNPPYFKLYSYGERVVVKELLGVVFNTLPGFAIGFFKGAVVTDLPVVNQKSVSNRLINRFNKNPPIK